MKGRAAMNGRRDAAVDEVVGAFRALFERGGPPSLGPLAQDLTMAQLRALVTLARESPLGVGALGERLGIGLPAASRLVERMVGDGLAERWEDPADRRRALVRLGPRGRAAVERMQEGRQLMHGRLRGLLQRLPPDELEALRGAMRHLLELAGEEKTEARAAG